jgi:hypothetical protein
MSQADLKNYLVEELKYTHEQITVGDGFVYAQGSFPVLLVAHMDTVHEELPKTIFYNKITDTLTSPEGIGGDDRCGIYMILETIKLYNCSVLFCEDEEIGGIGAGKFVKTELAKGLTFNYIIEFDRKGSNDAVFYDCENPEFEKFITDQYYKTAFGSFSDISVIAPALRCAAVNLSCGYYNAHTTKEYVVLSEMETSIDAACAILDKTTEADKFEYIECDAKYDDWYKYGLYEDNLTYYCIEYYDKNYNEYMADVYAMSEEEAVGKFCIDHPDIPFANVFNIEAYEQF